METTGSAIIKVVLDGASVAATFEKYVFQRILKNEMSLGHVHQVRLE